jgi:tetratricopeptide (TPR) repeat protein
VLLDPTARATYDRNLAATGPQTARPVPPSAGTTDWVELARRYLATNDYNSALYAAREARNSGVTTPEVWSLMGRANAGLNKLDEALYEARQAADLSPADPQMHLDLGSIYEGRQEWEPAYQSFQAAHRLIPEQDGPRMAMAMVRAEGGQLDVALQEMEQLYANCQDRDQVGLNLALVLVRKAETVPRVRDGEIYFITSPVEITQMRKLLARAREVSTDPHALELIRDTESYVNQCASSKFYLRRFFGWSLRLSALMFLISFCTCAGNSMTWAIIFLLGGGGLVALAVMRARIPIWKTNSWTHTSS